MILSFEKNEKSNFYFFTLHCKDQEFGSFGSPQKDEELAYTLAKDLIKNCESCKTLELKVDDTDADGVTSNLMGEA